ncbi:hypothetical protein BDQ12DRAFT_671629 [Crucibulum laeve]|uniref:Uncharacterized protein n=1 Tax=Crucibulum laeve TaxID=68775 RepID=A0A5C3LF62_9AGAR|nr:hypothetical protein BDQ12DRAFT_671629 [Crucibulum laeve]
MPAPSKTTAELLAECRKAAEERCKQEHKEKEHEDAEIANLQAMADSREKVQEEKEAEAHREKAAQSAQHQLDVAQARWRTMKVGGLRKNVGKEQKIGHKQQGTELAELEVKCNRKNARACEACHNSQQACVFPGNEDKPQRKHKAAKAVDSDNKAGLSKRSNTMNRSSGRND